MLASSRLEYPRISMETVISLAPDVIVDVGEMGESPADSDRRRQITEGLWRSQTLVKAVRERRRPRRSRRGVCRAGPADRRGGENDGAVAPRSRAAMTPPVLRVRNVGWRAAAVPVLEHVSFDVAPGEFVAVMGRNGAGKSTLLDIVAGLRRRRKAP